MLSRGLGNTNTAVSNTDKEHWGWVCSPIIVALLTHKVPLEEDAGGELCRARVPFVLV